MRANAWCLREKGKNGKLLLAYTHPNKAIVKDGQNQNALEATTKVVRVCVLPMRYGEL